MEKQEIIENLIKSMASYPFVNTGKTVLFLSKKDWLRVREIGWFNFTDEELKTTDQREGLITETPKFLLYIQQKFPIKKERRFTSHNSDIWRNKKKIKW